MGEEYKTWRAEAHDVEIVYRADTMESMRQAAMIGLQKIPRRGLEVGGVLFGSHFEGKVRIEQWREIQCEHAMGPGFQLSAADEKQLAELLAEAAGDENLGDLLPVGWFRTRTQDGVELTGADVEFHNRYFPESWQIILVLRPRLYDPVRAGFFFRDAEGGVRTGAPHTEFELENRRRRLPLGYDPSQKPRRRTSVPEEPWSAGAPVAPADPSPGASVSGVSPPRRPATKSHHTPVPVPPPRDRYSGRMFALIVTGLLLVFLATLLIVPALSGVPRAALGLTAREVGGQIVLEWDAGDREVRYATGGSLRVTDGDRKEVYSLSVDELRGGTLVYQRQTGNVVLQFALHQPDGSVITATTRFAGENPLAPPPSVQAPDTAATKALVQELTRLRGLLQGETERTDRARAQLNQERQRMKRSRTQALSGQK